ncbi:NADPH-dependent FMN reductase [Oceanicella sp. SM1341]|uniref:NADPH-dependent FMN reductase n=1 Tax=Oceanicella sp. SM1341 TaxID=1548889 RepID=UPI000E4E22D4|nr:NAD(P)H-dependent oxidoreductase [Oceanicella sp. SM1341]
MNTKVKLLGISGSIRRASFNAAILKGLADSIADRAALELFPLHDIPLYDEDKDTATPPEAVARLRAAIGAADGLVIATPEYNHGMSGVLKNALDWASRPFGQSTLTGKPVLTLSSSPAATGGVRAQAQLNETLTAIGAPLVLRPQAVVGAVHDKIRDGRLVDAATLGFLSEGIDDLLRNIESSGSAISEEA